MKTCLDTWAVIAFLDDEEPAASRVESALESRPVMSWINLGEVYSLLFRRAGRQSADETVAALRSQLRPDVAGEQRTIEAARLQAVHALGLGDAYAAATAIAHDAVLLTGDPHLLDPGLGCAVEDLR